VKNRRNHVRRLEVLRLVSAGDRVPVPGQEGLWHRGRGSRVRALWTVPSLRAHESHQLCATLEPFFVRECLHAGVSIAVALDRATRGSDISHKFQDCRLVHIRDSAYAYDALHLLISSYREDPSSEVNGCIGTPDRTPRPTVRVGHKWFQQ
jgi:hypothetical protein